MRKALLAFGLLAAPAVHADVSVRFTSTPVGGQYAPKHVMAAWVEKADGTFIKTIARWANNPGLSQGIAHLNAWRAKAGTNDLDAISGATQDAHIPRTIKWNLRDRAGAELPAGQYVIKIELTDRNSAGQVGTFTVTKGGADGNQGTGLSNGGFVNVSIDYNNATQSCGDGYVDAGEVCDPGRQDSCPSVCPPSTIQCFQGVVVGNADVCSAQCVQQQIMACADGDGCCPEACDGTTDSDCPGGGGGGDDDPNGGVSSCASSAGAGWMLALLGFFFVARRRRR